MQALFCRARTMHKPTLDLRLRMYHIGKVLAHNVSMYENTMVQAKQSHILFRKVVGAFFCTPGEWLAWTLTPSSVLPLARERQRWIHALRTWRRGYEPGAPRKGPPKRQLLAIAQRGMPAQRPAMKTRRTAFTKKKRQQLGAPKKRKRADSE